MKIQKETMVYYSARKRSTLLIPDYSFPLLEELVIQYGDLRKVLYILMRKYHKNHKMMVLKNEISSTLKYQEVSLDLHRVHFRPIESDWIQLKILAGSFNLSICAFFALLLRLEMAGALGGNEKNGAVPPLFPKISLNQAITLYSVPRFTRLLYVRV